MKELLIHLIDMTIVIFSILYIVINNMKNKPKRDPKSGKFCPESGRQLTATELFYGRCFQCPEYQQKTCQKIIKEQQDEPRKRI